MSYGSDRRRVYINLEDDLAGLLRDLAAQLVLDLRHLRRADGSLPPDYEAETGRAVSSRLIAFFLGPVLDPYNTSRRPPTPLTPLARLIHQAVTDIVELAAEHQRDIMQRRLDMPSLMALGATTRRDPAFPAPYYQTVIEGRILTDRLWAALEATRKSLVLFLASRRDLEPEAMEGELGRFLDQRFTLPRRNGAGTNGGYPSGLVARTAVAGAEAVAILYMSRLNPAVQEVNILRTGQAACTTGVCVRNAAGGPYRLDQAPTLPSHGNCVCYYATVEGEPIMPEEIYLNPLSPVFVNQLVNGV